ncbi:hypothetical protein DFH09DRAFT_1282581 [Mycena vulgaris]|nr:hypothetical protein DFH09DRAFT_1282581 [Mycena vulgaris]
MTGAKAMDELAGAERRAAMDAEPKKNGGVSTQDPIPNQMGALLDWRVPNYHLQRGSARYRNESGFWGACGCKSTSNEAQSQRPEWGGGTMEENGVDAVNKHPRSSEDQEPRAKQQHLILVHTTMTPRAQDAVAPPMACSPLCGPCSRASIHRIGVYLYCPAIAHDRIMYGPGTLPLGGESRISVRGVCCGGCVGGAVRRDVPAGGQKILGCGILSGPLWIEKRGRLEAVHPISIHRHDALGRRTEGADAQGEKRGWSPGTGDAEPCLFTGGKNSGTCNKGNLRALAASLLWTCCILADSLCNLVKHHIRVEAQPGTGSAAARARKL